MRALLNYFLNQTPILEWCVVRSRSKNEPEKGDMCLKEIGLWAQNWLTTLGSNSQQNWGDLYDHVMNSRIFTLTMNKIFIWAPRIMRKMATDMIQNCQSSRTNCVEHIVQEVGAELIVSIYLRPAFLMACNEWLSLLDVLICEKCFVWQGKRCKSRNWVRPQSQVLRSGAVFYCI